MELNFFTIKGCSLNIRRRADQSEAELNQSMTDCKNLQDFSIF